MGDLNKISVIIPSLDPTDTLINVVTELIGSGFDDIIIINDGSESRYSGYFEALEKLEECTVLTHAENKGKGAALKTAFEFFIRHRQGKLGVITADSDGQHLTSDVVKCACAMIDTNGPVIMGVRDFKKDGVPARNSFANRLTALSLRILFGVKLRDSQTGLRGIPAGHIPFLLHVAGNRFEYETNMLIELERSRIPFLEVEIETVYAEGLMYHTHYRPLTDSVIIFSRIFRYASSSILSFLVDISIFWLAIRFLSDYFGALNILFATVTARIVSSFINYNANRSLVFNHKEGYVNPLWRYYALACMIMLMSAGALWGLALLSGVVSSAWLLTLLKILVDAMLFFASYHIQRIWVFRRVKGM